jgi:hypothetical protein
MRNLAIQWCINIVRKQLIGNNILASKEFTVISEWTTISFAILTFKSYHTLSTYHHLSATSLFCFTYIFCILSLFWRTESRLMQSPWCLCVVYPFINFWIAELTFMKLGLYILASEPISTHKTFPSVYLCVYTGGGQTNGNNKKLTNINCLRWLQWKTFSWQQWIFFCLFQFCSAHVSALVIVLSDSSCERIG